MKQFRIAKFEFRIFSMALALTLFAAPVPSDAQQAGKVYRIGYLASATPPAPTDTTPQHCPIKGSPFWQALVEGLREHGYIRGQNLVLECRYTEGRAERAPAFAAELVSLKPDLIIANSTANVRAAKQATSTIPIVMVGVIDPVGRELVPSLARPGGNVTGLTDTLLEMMGKSLQLLKEVVPTVSRVAVLAYSTSTPEPGTGIGREQEAAARAFDMTRQAYHVREPEEFAGVFAAMTKAKAEALFVDPHPFWYSHRQRIVDLAAQHRLPAIYHDRDFVTAGGLMAYDMDRLVTFRRLGSYVDKIFKGAKPGDLPVEQPTKLDLLINLRTAKALGLTIPSSMLMRADQVIE